MSESQHAAHQFKRTAIDLTAYGERSRGGACFICAIVAHDPAYPAHVVYADERAIVFLNKYPTLYGYALVAPREHREQATGDFTEDEYLVLQRLIYRVGEAVRAETRAERVYILTLGSQQGNRHVHWHIVPLPPGVPYAEQQLDALDMRKGILDIPEREMAALAERLNRRIVSDFSL